MPDIGNAEGVSALIPTITPHGQLRGSVTDVTFAILDPQNNYCTVHEMADMYSATYGNASDKPVIDLVPFRPERALAQEIIIELSTKVQMNDLDNPPNSITEQATKLLSSIPAQDLKSFCAAAETIRRETMDKLQNPQSVTDAKEAESLARAVSEVEVHRDYLSCTPSPTLSEEQVRYLIAATNITNAKIREMATSFVSGKIDTLIESGQFAPITRRDAEERVSIAVTGGVASGKGSSVVKLRHNYELLLPDRSQNDTVKINGDSYKVPLSKITDAIINSANINSSTTAMRREFSQLYQDEATFLGLQVAKRVKQEVEQTGRAPDMFIDKGMLPAEYIAAATHGNGQLFVTTVSLPVEKAIERAYARGTKTSRFEPTKTILDTHRQSPQWLEDTVLRCKGKHVIIEVVDNDVPTSNQTTKVAQFNCANGAIEVQNPALLSKFCAKSAIDVSSVRFVQYNPSINNTATTFTRELRNRGYNISKKDLARIRAEQIVKILGASGEQEQKARVHEPQHLPQVKTTDTNNNAPLIRR